MDVCKAPGQPRDPVFEGDYSFNTGKIKEMSILDYLIIISAMCVTTLIGLYVAWKDRQSKCVDDYLLAGRSLSALPTALSFTGSLISGITVVGFPGVIYYFGTAELWHIVTLPIALAFSAVVFMPVFYNLRITSIYEYLEKRFSRTVRLLGAIYFILTATIYSSFELYSSSISVFAVTGLSIWVSVFTVGSINIIYTALGGMRAVVYTSSFHVIVKLLSLLVMIAGAWSTVGRPAVVWDSAIRTNRLTGFDLSKLKLDPSGDSNTWNILVSSFVYALFVFGADQVNLHRCLCCKSQAEATRVLWISAPLLNIIFILACVIGLYAGTFYENCDPVNAGLVKSGDEIIPLFVMDVLSSINGVPGLFMACVFCSTLSTVSSTLNSIAAVALQDFIRPFFWNLLQEKYSRLVIQIITVFFGLISLEITFLTADVEGGLFMLSSNISGALGAPLLGVFILGLLFPHANEKGALWGMLGSTAVSVFLKLWQIIDPPKSAPPPAITCLSNCNVTAFPETSPLRPTLIPNPEADSSSETDDALALSSRLYATIGVIATVTIGMFVSWLTAFRDTLYVEPELIVPILDELFPFYYLPEWIREKFRFGLNHDDKWSKYAIKYELNMKRQAVEMKQAELVAQRQESLFLDTSTGPKKGSSSEQKKGSLAHAESINTINSRNTYESSV